MTDPLGTPVSDEQLTHDLDRLAALSVGSGIDAPAVATLERRVHQRRSRRRSGVGATAAVLVALGLGAVAVVGAGDDGPQRLATGGSASQPAPTIDPVFTISAVPEGLSFRSCTAATFEVGAGSGPAGITCTIGDPAMGLTDGVRVSRIAGGVTPEARQAWRDGDVAAAVAASGGFDQAAQARFTDANGVPVLDLRGNLEPGTSPSASLRFLVGDDLVDIGSANVTTEDLIEIIRGATFAAPTTEVVRVQGLMPAGTAVAIQGDRPSWGFADPADPVEGVGPDASVWGAELVLPDDSAIGYERIEGIDADVVLDELIPTGDPGVVDTEISGRRAVVVEADGTLIAGVPLPRTGPQLFLRVDDGSLIRLTDPDGSVDRIRSLAAQLG